MLKETKTKNCEVTSKMIIKMEINPFLIPEIIDAVLKRMSSSDLKTCRLVNRQWDSLSSYILRSRVEGYVRLETTSQVQSFHDCISNSRTNPFPYTHFKLNCMFQSSLKLKKLKIFSTFKHINIQIKRLVITELPTKFDIFNQHDQSMKSLYFYLFHCIHEVEYLEIQCKGDSHSPCSPTNTSKYSRCWEGSKASQQIQLSKLKVLKMSFMPKYRSHFAHFIHGIIGVAKNLQELNAPLGFDMMEGNNSKVTIIEGLIKSGRISIIKEISFDSRSFYWKNIELLETFAEGEPKIRNIEELSFPFLYPSSNFNLNLPRHQWCRIENCFTKIFKSSANTLQSISLSPMGFLKGFQLPCMNKLEQLCIIVGTYRFPLVVDPEIEVAVEDASRLFPSSVYFSDKLFPKLKEVQVEWKSDVGARHEWEATFGETPNNSVMNIGSVESIVLKGVPSSGNWLQELSKVFPNTKEIYIDSLHSTDNFRSFNRHLFSSFCSSDLENVAMTNIDDERIWNKVAYMDSSLTGISEKECRKLQKSFCCPNPNNIDMQFQLCSETIDNLRQYPSILALKKLKSFTVTLRDFFSLNSRRQQEFLFPVTMLCTLNQHPHLEIVNVGHGSWRRTSL